MKDKIVKLLNGMAVDSKSASYKCEKELCKILTSIIDKKHKIETYADQYIMDYPEKITDISNFGVYDYCPDNIWCNDEEFRFETKWLDIEWEKYFEELKQSSIRGIEHTIKLVEGTIIKHKERLNDIFHRTFNDLKFCEEFL